MAEFNWVCPTCKMLQTVGENRCDTISQQHNVGVSKHDTYHIVETKVVCCSNPKCKDVYFYGSLFASNHTFGNRGPAVFVRKISSINSEPEHAINIQPDCIPEVIREDYYEACKILHLSPKASATLTRRCLQGMIRDFCKISKPTLYAEIDSLKKLYEDDSAPKGVTDETVEAIDHVRTIGNIGAHMEKDISHIVEIDPGEAEALITLVELLFEEWYVARNKRGEKLARIKSIAAKKAEDKKQSPAKEEGAE